MIRTCSYLKAHAEAFIFGLVLIWMAAAPGSLWCQSSWPSYPNNNTITVTSGGNVGIGTSSPGATLDVAGASRLTRDGGTASLSSPQGALTVGLSNTASAAVGIGPSVLGSAWNSSQTASFLGRVNFVWDNPQAGSEAGAITFTTRANTTDVYALSERMRITSAGNVGIGTTNPQYLLSVKGTVGAQEFIVTNTGWSDYVFRPDYRLRPLSEVSQYIQANGHLPDIPTEAEVKEKGVSIGDMQAKLLAKVEELTLHMIRQEKENGELRDKMNEQTKEIQDLRERLAKSAATDSRPAVAK